MHVTLPAIFLPHARKPRLFPGQLDCAYQRNLAALVRRQPVPGKTVSAQARPERKGGSQPAPQLITTGQPSGQWIAGVAPGPAQVRGAFTCLLPPGLVAAPAKTFALLVMLHGCRQTGSDLAAISRMNRIATRKPFWCSTGTERMANAQGCWNWYDASGKTDAGAPRSSPPWTRWRGGTVDLSRVAVAGLSAGASMAALLAALYPTRFCAVAMHSGWHRAAESARQRLGRHARHP